MTVQTEVQRRILLCRPLKWISQGLKAEVDSSHSNLTLRVTHGHQYLTVPPCWQVEAASLEAGGLSKRHTLDASLVGESRLNHFHSCQWAVYKANNHHHLLIVCSTYISALSTSTNKKQQHLLLPSMCYQRGGMWAWLAGRLKQWICSQLTQAYIRSSCHIAGRWTAEPIEKQGRSNH